MRRVNRHTQSSLPEIVSPSHTWNERRSLQTLVVAKRPCTRDVFSSANCHTTNAKGSHSRPETKKALQNSRGSVSSNDQALRETIARRQEHDYAGDHKWM